MVSQARERKMAFKSVLDPQFKYRNAVSTDLRKTFERIRREQELQRERAAEKQADGKVVVQITAVR
jgi:hypothetical protein